MQERPPVHADEPRLPEVGDDQVRLAPAVLGGRRRGHGPRGSGGRRRRLGQRRGDHGNGEEGEEKQHRYEQRCGAPVRDVGSVHVWMSPLRLSTLVGTTLIGRLFIPQVRFGVNATRHWGNCWSN